MMDIDALKSSFDRGYTAGRAVGEIASRHSSRPEIRREEISAALIEIEKYSRHFVDELERAAHLLKTRGVMCAVDGGALKCKLWNETECTFEILNIGIEFYVKVTYDDGMSGYISYLGSAVLNTECFASSVMTWGVFWSRIRSGAGMLSKQLKRFMRLIEQFFYDLGQRVGLQVDGSNSNT